MYCQTCGNTVGANLRFCPKCGGRSLGDHPPTAPAVTKLVQGVQPSQAATVAASSLPVIQGEFAGFWIRVTAALVDLVLLTSAILVISLPLLLVGGLNEATGTIMGSIVGWIYSAASESSVWQATPAKKFFGLYVCSSSGTRIGFWRATLRYLLKMPACLFISLFMIALRSDKRSVHDLVAGTTVYKK